MNYPLLFSGARLGAMELKNRLIMAPMGTNFGSEDEALSERQILHYRQMAQGGVGLIVTESCPVSPKGAHGGRRIKIYGHEADVKLAALSQVIHDEGCKIVMQLTHGGRKCSPEIIGEYPVAPSSLPIPKRDYIPRALSQSEIQEIVEDFAKAADIARRTGFDGLQLLAASGHLIHQFLSPISNRRGDPYGGPLENRCRFLMEIISRIKEVTEHSLPITVKLYGPDPGDQQGTDISLDDLVAVASLLAAAGVAGVHLSTNYASDPEKRRLTILELAKRMRQAADLKIALAGGIFEASTAERLLEGGHCDFIEMGRQLLADPDFGRKTASHRETEVRPCLNCNYCRYMTNQKSPIQCTVNPFLGREMRETTAFTKRQKEVLIIGGGPAGLQAALSLSRLGFSGTVYEKGEGMGGLLWAASAAPGKERLGEYLKYVLAQFAKSRFRAVVNTEITSHDLDHLPFQELEAVVVATGAIPVIPQYLNGDSSPVFFASEVLARKTTFRGQVIVLGGGQSGCETADFLSEDPQCQVKIMTASPHVARSIPVYERTPLLKRLGGKGVPIIVNAEVVSLDGTTLTFIQKGKEKKIGFGAIIVAKGWAKNHVLKENLEKKWDHRVFLIGDAFSPRSLLEAIEEGARVAEQVKGLVF